jgi:hypothetical protein
LQFSWCIGGHNEPRLETRFRVLEQKMGDGNETPKSKGVPT